MQTYDGPRPTTRPHTAYPVAEAPFSEKAEQFAQLSVVACSLCLRVLRDSTWVEAEEAIRELRTYELATPVALAPGLCDVCVETIRARRDPAALRQSVV